MVFSEGPPCLTLPVDVGSNGVIYETYCCGDSDNICPSEFEGKDCGTYRDPDCEAIVTTKITTKAVSSPAGKLDNSFLGEEFFGIPLWKIILLPYSIFL
jgi:hypothetical protein